MSAAHPAFAATTATAVTINTPTLVMGETTTATATVTDTSGTPATPTGTVTWSDGGTSGTYNSPCTLSPLSASSSSCSITYGPGGAFSSVTLTASYSGDAAHSTSTDSALITVNKRATATSVSPN
ncbi:MAG TPA: Ig-like domain repeat protein, partial [Vicinamibacterales bacterium]